MFSRLVLRHARHLSGAGVAALTLATGAKCVHCEDSAQTTTDILETLYSGLSDIHDIPGDEQRCIEESGGHEAYGELTIRGGQALRALLAPREDDVFYDLGSGAGRLVLQAALEWPCQRSVGIELAKSRHMVGKMALSRASREVRERAVLKCADMIACEGCEDATLVYVASLLFDDPFMSLLGGKLAQLPHLRTIAALTRFPPGSLPGFVDDERNSAPDMDAAVLRERLEVTWGAARVFLYYRQDEPPPSGA